ncbi:hypothetical protein CEUSTIGMA_g3591.t1 [Chlamydomonas eustigma]|uniref:Uncharacterized protein n=1 Tax=Chlamydomonas eustigma TaxID=1157962 RepID=A0A250WZ80_9CHLO|nr:hypothetical protein CEUSTIGMA_g3591.t1 [Chlamydomonas eustigma]|eukprot:GAX76147.1 hypothetical protein CEUSTIGMA_g3591.t1 [Chlamydomonas eustigma]
MAAKLFEEKSQLKIEDNIRQYETFLNEVLRRDLAEAKKKSAQMEEDLREYESLEQKLSDLRQGGRKPFKSEIDLGSEILCQAKVADVSHIFIAIGLGFHVECSLEEAPSVIDIQKQYLQTKIEGVTQKVHNINAHIALVQGGIRELMGLGI